ncbi:hypothetical protein CYMTET_37399 [Cymbomonas tetramitiformis]|uniref:Uncharacterized protein n=1 Tax=Cymbomonas tetramitiformis TaxID=36881 RepID=A0AAE0CFX0_9CHLO|nr:hypothetical protein CYMTET_37399 [Cymbomonas tetramitiformis]
MGDDDGGDSAGLSWVLQFDTTVYGSTVPLSVCAEACAKRGVCVAFSHRGVPGDDTCVFYKAIPSGVACDDRLCHMCYVNSMALDSSSVLARNFKRESPFDSRGFVSHCVAVRSDDDDDDDGEDGKGAKRRDDGSSASEILAYTWNSTRDVVGKLTSRAVARMHERVTRAMSVIQRHYAKTT